MSGVLVYVILITVIFFRFMRQTNEKKSGKGEGSAGSAGKQAGSPARNSRGPRRPMASDGHRVPKDQDISCRRYGHRHEEFDTPRFIPHSDPEEGWIILNGVKMKLSEADSYENRI